MVEYVRLNEKGLTHSTFSFKGEKLCQHRKFLKVNIVFA